MRKTHLGEWPCSVAQTFDVFGDWWIPLIMREVFYGVRRFDDFQRRLDIGRNVLTTRLNHLVDEGILERVPYQERPTRYEYRLTDKGRASVNIVFAAMRWGDDWLADHGPPAVLRDRRTGAEVRPLVIDEHTGEPIDPRQVTIEPGPGFPGEFRGRTADEWFPPLTASSD
jgi:DNA-binding HxlR family transcriptional regulator